MSRVIDLRYDVSTRVNFEKDASHTALLAPKVAAAPNSA